MKNLNLTNVEELNSQDLKELNGGNIIDAVVDYINDCRDAINFIRSMR